MDFSKRHSLCILIALGGFAVGCGSPADTSPTSSSEAFSAVPAHRLADYKKLNAFMNYVAEHKRYKNADEVAFWDTRDVIEEVREPWTTYRRGSAPWSVEEMQWTAKTADTSCTNSSVEDAVAAFDRVLDFLFACPSSAPLSDYAASIEQTRGEALQEFRSYLGEGDVKMCSGPEVTGVTEAIPADTWSFVTQDAAFRIALLEPSYMTATHQDAAGFWVKGCFKPERLVGECGWKPYAKDEIGKVEYYKCHPDELP